MAVQQVRTVDIYHGLPVHDESIQGLTAVITGANGISGYHMLQVLARSPSRWRKIYCLSRRPPYIEGGLPSNAEHVAIDFLTSPEAIAAALKERGVQADYVFFFAYLQPAPKEDGSIWSQAEELTRVNAKLLGNFLGALKMASIQPKRFMLQTGAKHYNIHLGAAKVPQEESDPRVEIEPNFYYAQEDLLFQYCQEEGVGWNVHMPASILGAVPDAAMNLAFPLAVYAAVSAELKQPLEWSSDIDAWQRVHFFSSATLNAYMEEWSVLTNEAKNHRFNTVDDSPFTWEAFWPHLAGWYGLEWKGPDPDASFTESEVPHNPRGYGPKAVVRVKLSLVDWAKRPEVQETWSRLAERHKLAWPDLREPDRVFGFLDAILLSPGTVLLSMDKSKKMGWRGFVDTTESFLSVLDDLARIKMIPAVPKIKV